MGGPGSGKTGEGVPVIAQKFSLKVGEEVRGGRHPLRSRPAGLAPREAQDWFGAGLTDLSELHISCLIIALTLENPSTV